MFRKIAVALIATSVLAAPALAQDPAKTTPVPPAVTQSPTANAAVKPEGKPAAAPKVNRHRHHARHHRHHRHHMYAGKHRHHVYAGKHRSHVRYVVATKPGKVLTSSKTPKREMHNHRSVKAKKPIKTNRNAVLKPANPIGTKVKRS